MAHYLVIVESLKKVKTIKKIPLKQLYSYGIKRTCKRPAKESAWY